jgi:hypothetical protein
MSTLGIPFKTPEGVAEMAQRRLALSQRHRTLLLLIDGRRPLAEVLRLAQQAGVPAGHIDELVAAGLVIVPLPEAPPASMPTPTMGTSSAGVRVSVAQPVAPPVPAPLPARPRGEAPPVPQGEEAPEDLLRVSRIDIVVGSHFHQDGPGQAIEPLTPSSPTATAEHETGPTASELAALDAADLGLAQARALLSQALKDEAPVVGALTLMRVRRAHDRAALRALLPEVRQRLSRQRRVLDASDVLRRARECLDQDPLSR